MKMFVEQLMALPGSDKYIKLYTILGGYRGGYYFCNLKYCAMA